MLNGLRVLFIASEADPLVKIGGLGDVAGSLPKALCNLPPEPGNQTMDVRLVIPFHGAIRRQAYSLTMQPAFRCHIKAVSHLPMSFPST